MSAGVPVEAIIAAFPDQGGADAAMNQLKQAKREHLIKIKEAAVLKRDAGGKLHIDERNDLGAAGGAGAGAVIGVVASMIVGPLGPLLGGAAGAAIGGIAGREIDRGLNDQRLKKLGDSLTPGTSAIVAVVEHTWVRDLTAELDRMGADVATEQIAADVHQQLVEGRTVAYDALRSEEGAIISRAAGDESGADISAVAIDESGITAVAGRVERQAGAGGAPATDAATSTGAEGTASGSSPTGQASAADEAKDKDSSGAS